jgi:hypothetical protein
MRFKILNHEREEEEEENNDDELEFKRANQLILPTQNKTFFESESSERSILFEKS